MTDQTHKNRKWAIVFGAGFLLFYLFLDFFWDKMWVLSFFPLLFFVIGFLVFVIKAFMKKERHVVLIFTTFIVIIAGIEIAKSETFKSPIILNAALKDDLSVIYLRLRENRTFEVVEGKY